VQRGVEALFRSNCDACTALRAAGVDDGAAACGFHANQKTMGLLATGDGRLIGAFHVVSCDLPSGETPTGIERLKTGTPSCWFKMNAPSAFATRFNQRQNGALIKFTRWNLTLSCIFINLVKLSCAAAEAQQHHEIVSRYTKSIDRPVDKSPDSG